MLSLTQREDADTRQSSRGRLGRISDEKTARISEMRRAEGRTDRQADRHGKM